MKLDICILIVECNRLEESLFICSKGELEERWFVLCTICMLIPSKKCDCCSGMRGENVCIRTPVESTWRYKRKLYFLQVQKIFLHFSIVGEERRN